MTMDARVSDIDLDEDLAIGEALPINPVLAPLELGHIPDNTNKQRPFDQAILYACQHSHSGEKESKRLLKLVDALDLVPFAFDNSDEENALANPVIVQKLSLKCSSSIRPILPTKRTADKMEEALASASAATPGLTTLLPSSPLS
ncbi:hypothetical protein DM01DRAFT_311209 [Hesseltinella vesiculosa]|uniref:Uncharacterized protein n=1 Tax=Hesseltinella vesiculosa TaxID=101127 RepID=A0A1X2GQ26_9FUNG|nr:hypothetical protein DM01DRAFT_311209 [Hesseltinella vesiculosa]